MSPRRAIEDAERWLSRLSGTPPNASLGAYVALLQDGIRHVVALKQAVVELEAKVDALLFADAEEEVVPDQVEREVDTQYSIIRRRS